MRSKLAIEQIYEYESSVYVEKVIIRNGWKYREQEKDNDIDGEIEVFSSNGETTAKIIKVQLKASLTLKYEENYVVFDCPVKFLNYCDVCDLPVLLVVYDVSKEKAYWIWTQFTIFKDLNPQWRSNTSKVRLRIPISNEFKEDTTFYKALEKISIEGVNEVHQLRKHETSEYYYTILEEEDQSNLQHKRISAKVYIERSFASSKEALKELIKKINERVKSNNYSKEILNSNYEEREPNYIWLYFYDDLIQYKTGLPFCKTEWISSSKDNLEPILLRDYDDVIDELNIKIKWESQYRPLQEYYSSNTLSKTEYLKSVKEIKLFVEEQLSILPILFNENKTEFSNQIKINRVNYNRNFIAMSDILSPIECKEFNSILYDALSSLDNLADDIEKDRGNDFYINRLYISKFNDLYVILKYEFKKML